MSSVNSFCFGVVTPTFNRPELLKRAIESVIHQTYQNWVMIIVDDCSTEDYGFISEFLADNRIIYFKNNINSGVNYCRNEALIKLEEIGCDYITFLDDDDYIVTPNTFSNVLGDISSYPDADWYIYDVINYSETNNKDYPIVMERIDYINDYLYGNKLLGDKHHFINSNIAKNIRFSSFIRNGFEWTYFIQFANVKTLYISKPAKVIEYQEAGLTQVGQKKKPRNIILQTALPTFVWFRRPKQMKAFRRMVTLSLKLPFRLIISLFR